MILWNRAIERILVEVRPYTIYRIICIVDWSFTHILCPFTLVHVHVLWMHACCICCCLGSVAVLIPVALTPWQRLGRTNFRKDTVAVAYPSRLVSHLLSPPSRPDTIALVYPDPYHHIDYRHHHHRRGGRAWSIGWHKNCHCHCLWCWHRGYDPPLHHHWH